ncbi:MAG: 3-phosphoserine/phosphohydroxythreonine transaminase [Bacteroidales bacterium]|nr:3-phosphoserine/phosphohydroxythreonine transaminase [Bacteroidales bacterium]
MKKHNFNPGPAILPKEVLENTAKAVIDLDNSGLSIMEISHRSKEFENILNETVELFKELLNIPSGYHVLFLGGGAHTQFYMVPHNFLNTKAAYLETGEWAQRAIKEAQKYGEVNIVASSKDKNFTYIPKGWTIPTDVDYFHITTNNTIFGTELRYDIESPVPLVADMSSDFCSRPIDVSKYSLIYAGAQKNVGPAGVTIIIIKEDFLNSKQVQNRVMPLMLDYKVHVKNNSLFNTPPVINIYVVNQTLKWLKSIGGVAEIEKINLEKAKILYEYLDNSKMFVGTVVKEDRSIMNVCFVMRPEYKEKEEAFLEFAKQKGIVGIKGHRSVGGFRASLYNALPLESVKYLIQVMDEFERNNK